jgi:hypothetical protein
MDMMRRGSAKIANILHLPWRHHAGHLPWHCHIELLLAAAIVFASTSAARADRLRQSGMIPPLAASSADVSPGGLRLQASALTVMRPSPAFGSPASAPLSGLAPGLQCRQAIRGAEQAARIPDQLLAAIGRIESGRSDAAGVVHPWPWTINAEGVGSYFQTKAEALAAVRALQARGVKSIDVGCMQVNLMYHPEAFASLEQAFDPAANAAYAARFLNQLLVQTGSWTKATAYYHSATPGLGDNYQRKVAAVLPDEQKRLLDAPAPAPGGNVWSINAFSASAWSAGGIARPAAASAAQAAPTGNGGFMLANRVDQARMLPMAAGAVGRGLDAYRAMTIPVSGAVPVRVSARGALQMPGRAPLL